MYGDNPRPGTITTGDLSVAVSGRVYTTSARPSMTVLLLVSAFPTLKFPNIGESLFCWLDCGVSSGEVCVSVFGPPLSAMLLHPAIVAATATPVARRNAFREMPDD